MLASFVSSSLGIVLLLLPMFLSFLPFVLFEINNESVIVAALCVDQSRATQ